MSIERPIYITVVVALCLFHPVLIIYGLAQDALKNGVNEPGFLGWSFTLIGYAGIEFLAGLLLYQHKKWVRWLFLSFVIFQAYPVVSGLKLFWTASPRWKLTVDGLAAERSIQKMLFVSLGYCAIYSIVALGVFHYFQAERQAEKLAGL